MTAIKTLTVSGGKIEMVRDTDGRFRWYAADGDTEVSGATEAEAMQRAYAAWPEAEQLN